jgi:hypothetical protein
MLDEKKSSDAYLPLVCDVNIWHYKSHQRGKYKAIEAGKRICRMDNIGPQ